MGRKPNPVIVWFRLDLRLADHPALTAAAKAGAPVIPLYILDDHTRGGFGPGGASRWWLNGGLESLGEALAERGGSLALRRGAAPEVLDQVLAETGASAIYATRGYEPWESRLENDVGGICALRGASLKLFPGRLLSEPEVCRTREGKPYRVFTPFLKACLAAGPPRPALPAPKHLTFASIPSDPLRSFGLLPTRPDWADGFRARWRPGETSARARLNAFIAESLARYADDRSKLDGHPTSELSPHLHFGEISPNRVWHAVSGAMASTPGVRRGGEVFLREMIWREFSYHLLFHFPALPAEPLRPEFKAFPWRSDPKSLTAWQRGMTGYPVVDAAMRELWHTGWMPNRARMIVASFLVKHLLIPWQKGADWFLDTLVDADLANNSANWQWVAGCGADAAPYFRIFNPVLQGRKFDPGGAYVRRWVPELARLTGADIHAPWEASPETLAAAGVKLGNTYPYPIVEQREARTRALAAFKSLADP